MAEPDGSIRLAAGFGDQGNDDAPSRLLERLAGQTLQAEPGAYSVRLEMHPCDKDYLSFMEETGAEYVGRMLQWVYFRKKLTDGPFDLFSDIDSRIRHLERVGNPLLVLGLANLAIGITNSIQANAEYAWINLLCATLLWALFMGYVILRQPVIYNGWRHFYFLYAGFIVLAAWGLETLQRRAKGLNGAAIAGILALCMAAKPAQASTIRA